MRKLITAIPFFAVNLLYAQQATTMPAQAAAKPVHDYVRCINMEEQEKMLEAKDPGRKARLDLAVAMSKRWIENQSINRVAQVETQYTIPVAVHIIWNSNKPTEVITVQQVRRQIKVLNDDYNRLNKDTSKTPSAFRPAAASFHITFCLAQTTPWGQPSDGVIYKQTNVNSFTNDDAVKYPSLGGDTIWDPNKYLNIWVCNLSGGLLGYSEFPTMPLDNTFGSVIFFEAIGDSGDLPLPAYNLGRTVTHEVGHLLNLHHPWGDDGGLCPGSGGTDDGCADTPPEGNNKNDGFGDGGGPTFNAPHFPYTDNCSTVSPGIMFQNYMEYTNDSCMNLFTNDQYAIALATIHGPLATLVTSNACTLPLNVTDPIFNNSVNIYPNPSYTGMFSVAIGLTNIGHVNVEVYNVLGQTVDSWSSDNAQNTVYDLNLSSQPNGLYFARIYNNDFSVVKKIMINR